jgi:hypothetical protein
MSRITIQIADRVAALMDLLEAESDRDQDRFAGSREERLL